MIVLYQELAVADLRGYRTEHATLDLTASPPTWAVTVEGLPPGEYLVELRANFVGPKGGGQAESADIRRVRVTAGTP